MGQYGISSVRSDQIQTTEDGHSFKITSFHDISRTIINLISKARAEAEIARPGQLSHMITQESLSRLFGCSSKQPAANP
jgi:hypothetical protein